jgi:RNA polymerase sigma-70 factor (sigma-E family)
LVDERLFAAFLRRHSSELFRLAYLLSGDPHSAEELLQDTFARLLARWDRVEGADSPLAYVRRSLVNAYTSSRRRPASRDVPMWDPPDVANGADLAQELADRDRTVALLQSLPVRQRTALVLRYLHGLSDAEIADILGCRLSTVRSVINRGAAAARAESTRLDQLEREQEGRSSR